jgi:hypothetical protein
MTGWTMAVSRMPVVRCVPLPRRRNRRWGRVEDTRGSALVETALMLPVLLFLMLNMVNLGFYIYGWLTVNNAARAAIQYHVYSGVAVGFLGQPTYAQVCANVWYPDVSSLPNRGTGNVSTCTWQNITLKLCSKTGSAAAVCTGTGPDVPSADPSTYTVYSANVTYTFTPVFAAFTLPVVNIPLTILPASVHEQVVMRSMQ